MKRRIPRVDGDGSCWLEQGTTNEPQPEFPDIISSFLFDGYMREVVFFFFSRSVTSDVSTGNTFVKDWMTYIHERTLTERHTEYNTNTTCRCTRLHPPPPSPPRSVTTSVLACEFWMNSNIIQRLPRVELTDNLSRTFPILSDYQCPHCWNTLQKIILELDLLRVELTNHRSRTYAERQYTKGLLRDEYVLL